MNIKEFKENAKSFLENKKLKLKFKKLLILKNNVPTKKIIENISQKYHIIIDKIKTLKKPDKTRLLSAFVNQPKKLFQSSQNLIERNIVGDKEEVLLKQSNKWVTLITSSIIGGTLFGFGWLAIAKTEEIVIVRGKLEPLNGIVKVNTPFKGITKSILVKEGERVKKNQVLIVLDQEITYSKKQSLEKSLAFSRLIAEKYRSLLNEGAIAEIQLLDQENKVSQLESQLKESEVNYNYQEIKAPIDGIIFELKPTAIGVIADTQAPLIQIVPIEKLVAKVEIENRSIGFVSVGKLAEISIDSFPATDFGTIEGKISKIGSDVLPPIPALEKGYRFPAEIELDNQYLQLKNGKQLNLQVGMSLTANIKLRKVSYLQLILSTFKDKAKSLRTL